MVELKDQKDIFQVISKPVPGPETGSFFSLKQIMHIATLFLAN